MSGFVASVPVLSRPRGRTGLSALFLAALCATFHPTALASFHPRDADVEDADDQVPLSPAPISAPDGEDEAETPIIVSYDRHPGTGHVLVARLDEDAHMRIDGRLDEPAWADLEVHDDFRLIDPDTLEPAVLPTELVMFYNDRGLYVGARMTQDPDTLVEYLSGRDQGFLNRDYFSFTLDTSGEGRYGFWFQLNLGDSKSDGTILPTRNYDFSWDGAWWGATARTDSGWSAEFFVPWSLVNMPKANGMRTMGIFAQRKVAHADETHAWPPLPWTKPKFMSEFQRLSLTKVNPRQQYGVIPYVSAGYDRFGDGTARRGGVDVFWRPSSNFQLTSTLNPDFGNVEADDVIINLSNYETFFPEKRPFFQEGQEIFTTNSRMSGGVYALHTRRMGGPAVRPEVPEGVVLSRTSIGRPADLIGAVKATGQTGSVRYGFLGVAEEEARFEATRGSESVTLREDGRDFGAVRVLYEHSNGGYRSLGFLSTAVRHPRREASVNAVDGRFTSTDGRFRASGQVIASDTTGTGQDGVGGILDFGYTPRQGLSHYVSFDAFDDSIHIGDMGYLRRNDYRRAAYSLWISESDLERFRESRGNFRVYRGWNTNGETVDAKLSYDHRVTLHNLTQLRFEVEYEPERYDDRGSFGHGSYRVEDQKSLEARYYSDSSRRFSYTVRHSISDQEIGHGYYRRSEANVRWRPTDRMTLALAVNYTDREAWLLHRANGVFATFDAKGLTPFATLSYFVNARQQLLMAFQWVAIKAEAQRLYRMADTPDFLMPMDRTPTARDDFSLSRMSLQLRYRWEIAPLSDLFVVYQNRASLSGMNGSSFTDLFSETFDETIGENLAIKLRYRFGS